MPWKRFRRNYACKIRRIIFLALGGLQHHTGLSGSTLYIAPWLLYLWTETIAYLLLSHPHFVLSCRCSHCITLALAFLILLSLSLALAFRPLICCSHCITVSLLYFYLLLSLRFAFVCIQLFASRYCSNLISSTNLAIDCTIYAAAVSNSTVVTISVKLSTHVTHPSSQYCNI